ncbi:MAG: hypothetical protein ACRDZO_04865 [Egibacteraceae bacterium]
MRDAVAGRGPRRLTSSHNVTLPWVLELGVVPLAAGGSPGTYDG